MFKEKIFKILSQNKKLPLIIILGVAAFFCFYGLDWGLSVSWAGDEGGMVSTAVRMLDQKTLYPNRFMYPSLTYYLLTIFCLPYYFYLKLSGQLSGLDFNGILEHPIYGYGFFLASRLASALAGIMIVWFIYLLAKKISGQKVGLIAGSLAALHPPLFAHAHWAKSDIFMTLVALISLYFFVRAVSSKKFSQIYLASFIGGLAISTKYNAALFLLLPFLISFLLVKYQGKIKIKQWLTFLIDKRFYFSCFLFIFGFLLATPYSLIKIKKFVVTILFQFVTRGGFLGFERSLGFIENPGIILTMTGYLIFGLIIISFIYLIVKNIYKINHLEIILLSAIVPYYLYLGTWRFNQPYYLIVIFPFLVILVASFLSFIQKKFRFGYIFLIIFFLYNFWFAINQVVAFTNETKIVVQEYLRENIPPEARIEVNYAPVFSRAEGFTNISVIGPNFRQLTKWEDFQRSDLFRFLRETYYKVSGQKMGPIQFLSEQVESNIEQFTPDALAERNPDYLILSSAGYQVYFDYPQAYPSLTNYYDNLINQKTDYKIIKKFPQKKFTPTWTNPEIIILKKQND